MIAEFLTFEVITIPVWFILIMILGFGTLGSFIVQYFKETNKKPKRFVTIRALGKYGGFMVWCFSQWFISTHGEYPITISLGYLAIYIGKRRGYEEGE